MMKDLVWVGVDTGFKDMTAEVVYEHRDGKIQVKSMHTYNKTIDLKANVTQDVDIPKAS